MGELDGAGVVCNKCKGTGKSHIHVEWIDFRGQQIRDKIKRVFQTNPGIGVGEGGKGGETLKLEDFGGIPYNEWLKNPIFPPKSEMRNYVCPAWWYQLADYSKKPRWDWCRIGGSSFTSCDHFKDKHECWERWDKEYGSQSV